MDFDEYDYLEKTVEEPDTRNDSSGKKDGDEKSRSRSSRRREEEGDGGGDGDRKKSRLEGENGERKEDYEDREKLSRSDRRDRDRRRSSRDVEREPERERERERDRDRDRSGRHREKEREREREKERERSRRSSSHSRRHRSDEIDAVDANGELPRARSRDRDLKEKDRETERESRARSRDREAKEKEREIERERRARSREREAKEKERELERESRAKSRDREAKERERENEREMRARSRDREAKEREREIERENRRYKDKKEAVEPEADPERDQRTVFAYQMPLKATERDVYEFFSQAGKVRDVRLIMDRNSRRSKGVGYVEFYDAMSVPMAIALSGHNLLGQPVMVKPSEAEKNLVQSTVVGGGAGVLAGPYGAVARKLYVGNLHFNMTEDQLRQVFEPFGPVELVQLPLDLETGLCKGFGFVQFTQLEHAKAAQSLNGKLEIAGRIIKVSAVTDHLGVQNPGVIAADFDDDDGGGLSLNAQSRAMLMQKLDRSGIATSVAGSLGVPLSNSTVPNQLPVGPPLGLPSAIPAPAASAVVISPAISEPIGTPSECLLLKNLFDPATETEPDYDVDIKEDVQEECSRYGAVDHIHVDKLSAGHVYLKLETIAAAAGAQRAMHLRWFAGRRISAVFVDPDEYEARFGPMPTRVYLNS